MINEKLAKKYCKEDISKIKNYDKAIADTTQTWHCHHMTETWWGCTAQDLIDNECYYNRKACELIFLTPEEHCKLHNKGKHLTDETKIKMSESKKGRTFTEEHRRNISEAHKGMHHTVETRQKMSEAQKGKHLSEETRRKVSESKKGRTLTEEHRRKLSEAHQNISDEARRKMSEARKGKTWKVVNGKRVWLSKEVSYDTKEDITR